MDVLGDGPTPWQRRLMAEGHREYPVRISYAVAHPEAFATSESIPRLARLVNGALVVADTIESERITSLLDLAFETLLTVGAGSGFRDYVELRDDALRLIDILAKRGAPISNHLLSAARFQSLLANSDSHHVRRTFIERAVSSSQSADERIRALLTLSRYHTDVSDYDGARHALDECAELLRDEALALWRPEYVWTLGLTYFYADPARSSRNFEEAVRLGRPILDNPVVRLPVARSLHYLGRLAASRHEFARALELFVEAERISNDDLIGHGFYHQRMAEVLVDHGTLEEAEFHLRHGQLAFDQVGQKSSGMALLGGTWARFYVRVGALDKADVALAAAIAKSRAEESPRIELILLAEKLRLRVHQRSPFGLPTLLLRAGWLYLGGESNRSPASAVRQFVIVGRQAARMLRPPQHGSTTPITCPCGEDHTVLAKGPRISEM